MSDTDANRVYVHIGSPKTGTTYLQEILWNNREALREAGVHYPGSRPDAHFHAAMDLQNTQFQVDWFDDNVPNAWENLVKQAADGPATVVVSHELFCTATPEQIERAMADLSFAEVHLVCTVRDLQRQLPAVWQEDVKNRHTISFEDFVAGVRGTVSEPDVLSELFWHRQDVPEILAKWGRSIPPERVHVVTVPPAGSSTDLVWHRFAELLGLRPEEYDTRVRQRNRSLGVAETELVRRLNQQLNGNIDWPTHDRDVKRHLAEEIFGGRKARNPLEVPERHREWLRQQSERITGALAESGYEVIGDLDELRPAVTEGPEVEPDHPDAAELAEVAIEALAEVIARDAAGRRAQPEPKAQSTPDAPRVPGLRESLVLSSDRHPTLRIALGAYRRIKRISLRTAAQRGKR
ncbi:hypothetical protein SAMN04487820_11359 [Actinopolyspora mzabensis]|uniref:Sulfotransferase family protein n=1 Tax=Actinopolyspora mzabensis TaxID=995066 RepID=A0A1G9EXN2_ACTMZ|nr:hypothetical protein [Actinopolyspora mzabensis]SDK80788.1 hypothetical protein SAMN04487820_11359 [Actinopolyspora mzabensis]